MYYDIKGVSRVHLVMDKTTSVFMAQQVKLRINSLFNTGEFHGYWCSKIKPVAFSNQF
jgi:hypothetical protein